MEIGQAGLLRPAAWPARAWFGLIKFRPGPGPDFFLGLFLLKGQAQASTKKLVKPFKPVKPFYFKKLNPKRSPKLRPNPTFHILCNTQKAKPYSYNFMAATHSLSLSLSLGIHSSISQRLFFKKFHETLPLCFCQSLSLPSINFSPSSDDGVGLQRWRR